MMDPDEIKNEYTGALEGLEPLLRSDYVWKNLSFDQLDVLISSILTGEEIKDVHASDPNIGDLENQLKELIARKTTK